MSRVTDDGLLHLGKFADLRRSDSKSLVALGRGMPRLSRQ